MNITNVYILPFLLLMSGCYKTSVRKEFNQIRKSTSDLTGHNVSLARSADMTSTSDILQKLSTGVTKEEATSIALTNNPTLQAHFETLGIAKADLEQAGLYTNPDIHGFFWPALQNSAAELEVGAFFNLSDLWQVPLKKNVQKDILEAVSYQILESILQLIKEVHIAYDDVLFGQKKLLILEQLTQHTTDLYNNLCSRQESGLASDLDIYHARISLNTATIDLMNVKNKLSHSFIALKRALGILPSADPIQLAAYAYDHIKQLKAALPPLETLQGQALAQRPEIMKSRVRIKQFKDTISLEKSKIFQEVRAGISFKRDFDNAKGIGPNFELSLPIFNQNQAQIARAEYLLNQAEKELISSQLEIQKEVQTHYLDFIHQENVLAIYTTTILPTNQGAIDYADTFRHVMQITQITYLQTLIDYTQNQKNALETEHKVLNAFSNLERAVGKKLTSPTASLMLSSKEIG